MPLSISVSEPAKVVETLPPITYVTYKVTTSDMPKGSVIRRFADFQWLAGELATVCPGAIVPACPEGQAVGRYDSEFVDTRRRPLERFLGRVARHAELSKAPIFDVFLYGNDHAFSAAKAKSTPSPATKAAAWMERAAEKANPMALMRAKSDDKNAADAEFDVVLEGVARWEALMHAVSRSASGVVHNSDEGARALRGLSEALVQLSREESGILLKPTLLSGGDCTQDYADLVETRRGREVECLEEPCQEYTGVAANIRRALALREEARLGYLSSKLTVVALQADYQKVSGVAGKEGQIPAKLEAIEKAQIAEHNAKTRLEKVSADFLSEFERFKNEKFFDLNAMLAGYMEAQLDFHRSSAALLEAALAKLKRSASVSASAETAADTTAPVVNAAEESS